MGLARFANQIDFVDYCSMEKDRSLTLALIQFSDSPLKFSSRFAHSPEWADGLDCWTTSFSSSLSNGSMNKSDLNRRHYDFHSEIGLYLPRHEKPNSAPISLKTTPIHSKIPTNHFTPERIRILMRKEKDLLTQNDSIDPRFLFQKSFPSPPVPTNSSRQSTSIDLKPSNEENSSLHHSLSKSPLRRPEEKSSSDIHPVNSSINSDALKTFLKEHLTSLLTRGTSTLGEMKEQQSNRSDSKVSEEKSSRGDETNSSNGNLFMRSNHSYQSSPVIYYQKSSLGLTVTPLELNSNKQFQNNDSSSSSSLISTRPVTQPIPQSTINQTTTTTTTALIAPPSHSNANSSQRFFVRKPMESVHYSSTGDLLSTNENSFKATENVRRIPFHHHQHRSTGRVSSNRPVPPTTIELLPPIISGKRLHIPLGNHRYL